MLDRLYGYEVSPVLWKKVMPRSVGRPRAERGDAHRRRARTRAHALRHRALLGSAARRSTRCGELEEGEPRSFGATLTTSRRQARRDRDGLRLAGQDQVGRRRRARRAGVGTRCSTISPSTDFAVNSVESKPYRRRPAAPFMTSTFQQEASRKLRLSSRAGHALRAVAVRKGLHHLHANGQHDAVRHRGRPRRASMISERYGSDFLPDAPRHYASKVKNAQEAHEAIRPAGETFRLPEQVAHELAATEARVYELIWQRTVASQMTDAIGETVVVKVARRRPARGRATEFSATGTIITHAGLPPRLRRRRRRRRRSRQRRAPPAQRGERRSTRRRGSRTRRATRRRLRRASPRRHSSRSSKSSASVAPRPTRRS